MRRLRRTKIVATLGPASSEPAAIDALFRAGADVFRINMSHTSHERMRALVAAVRATEMERGRPIGILVDLQGPKLRIGSFAGDAVDVRRVIAHQGRMISSPKSGFGARRDAATPSPA